MIKCCCDYCNKELNKEEQDNPKIKIGINDGYDGYMFPFICNDCAKCILWVLDKHRKDRKYNDR